MIPMLYWMFIVSFYSKLLLFILYLSFPYSIPFSIVIARGTEVIAWVTEIKYAQ